MVTRANRGVGFVRINKDGILNWVPSKQVDELLPAVVYDAARQFSITAGNPNGTWAYGVYKTTVPSAFAYCTDGLASTAFVPYPQWKFTTAPTSPAIFATSVNGPWTFLRMHTQDVYPAYTSVLRWLCPQDYKEVIISASFLQLDIQAMDLNIFINGVSVFTKSGSGSLSKTVADMVAGTTVDFSISGYIFNASTQIVAKITARALAPT